MNFSSKCPNQSSEQRNSAIPLLPNVTTIGVKTIHLAKMKDRIESAVLDSSGLVALAGMEGV
jgi:hypothetical protein